MVEIILDISAIKVNLKKDVLQFCREIKTLKKMGCDGATWCHLR